MSILTLYFAIGVLIVFIYLYNSLIFRKNNIDQSWGAVQAYMKKRYDLIPNLVAAVSAYVQHEKSLLTEITELRTTGLNTNLNEADEIKTSDLLTDKMKKLMISVENYPDLKSNQNFLQTQNALNDIEEQLAASRRGYNAAVTHYNNGIEMIPFSFVAKIMGLKKRSVFETASLEQEPVNVGDLFNKRKMGS